MTTITAMITITVRIMTRKMTITLAIVMNEKVRIIDN